MLANLRMDTSMVTDSPILMASNTKENFRMIVSTVVGDLPKQREVSMTVSSPTEDQAEKDYREGTQSL